MKAGDLVKPIGLQRIENRSKLEAVKTGIVLQEIRKEYGMYLIKRYVVLWDNRSVVEHAWMEIEKL